MSALSTRCALVALRYPLVWGVLEPISEVKTFLSSSSVFAFVPKCKKEALVFEATIEKHSLKKLLLKFQNRKTENLNEIHMILQRYSSGIMLIF